MEHAGKHALVTGGGTGIGAGIAIALAEAGAEGKGKVVPGSSRRREHGAGLGDGAVLERAAANRPGDPACIDEHRCAAFARDGASVGRDHTRRPDRAWFAMEDGHEGGLVTPTRRDGLRDDLMSLAAPSRTAERAALRTSYPPNFAVRMSA